MIEQRERRVRAAAGYGGESNTGTKFARDPEQRAEDPAECRADEEQGRDLAAEESGAGRDRR